MTLLSLLSLGLGGCAIDGGYIVDGTPPAGIRVSVAPPPLRSEPSLICPTGYAFVEGHWDWDGRWRWEPSNCVRRPGYIYIQPFFHGGIFYRGYWAPRGHRPPAWRHDRVPPPAPRHPPRPAPPPRGR